MEQVSFWVGEQNRFFFSAGRFWMSWKYWNTIAIKVEDTNLIQKVLCETDIFVAIWIYELNASLVPASPFQLLYLITYKNRQPFDVDARKGRINKNKREDEFSWMSECTKNSCHQSISIFLDYLITLLWIYITW